MCPLNNDKRSPLFQAYKLITIKALVMTSIDFIFLKESLDRLYKIRENSVCKLRYLAFLKQTKNYR